MQRGKGFINLHNHTNRGSMLDATMSVDDIIEFTLENDLKHAALTDHGSLAAVYEFWTKCKQNGINPIIGSELYYTTAPYLGCRELGQDERKRQYHMTVLAMNNEGYHNLLKLASIAAIDGFYFRPCITRDVFKEHSEGLIVLSGCPSAHIPSLLREGKYDEAKQEAMFYRNLLGDRYYIELMRHPVCGAPEYLEGRIPLDIIEAEQEDFIEMQETILEGLVRISEELSIPTVATNDAHYKDKESADLADISYAISQGKKVDDTKRRFFPCAEFYLKTEDEMLEVFPDHADAVHRTVDIAERCAVEIEGLLLDVKVNEDGKKKYSWKPKEYLMPRYPGIPEGMTERDFLRQLCHEGMEELGLSGQSDYEQRLKDELATIEELGWPGYFLILWDVIRFCRENGIRTGKGRGSASGSLVLYVLGVTGVDPIKHNLLFSRFLSRHRISPPDVDLDLERERRQEVIRYLEETYGRENVVQIGTVGLMSTKAAIKKVATAFSMPFDKANKLTAEIPNGIESIDEALKIASVKALYSADAEVRQIMDVAKQLEGMPQFSGIHAAGVIISPVKIQDICPVRGADGHWVTEWHMDEIEKIGLVKMDFLGLKTLDVVSRTLDEIRRNRDIEIDIDNIPYDDPDVYNMIGRADVTGVFQIESNMSRSYLVKMLPKKFEDIVYFLALIRPGTLDLPAPSGNGTMVDEFIRRMHGKSTPVPPHPLLKDVLQDSYQIMVMQEDLMRATQVLAGFSESDADTFRDVVGKKRQDQMPIQRERFIKGCVNNGISQEDAERVFDLMETFANYGFNKSHSVGYGMLTWETAYLRCHYKPEFLSALLTSVMDDPDKKNEYLRDARAAGIPIKPPSINISDDGFVADGDSIRFGLSAIKGVGNAALEAIFADRNARGSYNSYEEFVRRTYGGAVNKTVLEGLIKAGALDELGLPRSQMLASVEPIIKAFGSYRGKLQRIEKRLDVIGGWDDIAKIEAEREKLETRRQKAEEELDKSIKAALNQQVDELPAKELAAMEKELLGYYAGHHPLDEYRDYYTSLLQRPEFLVNSRTLKSYIGSEAVACGMVTSAQKRKGSNGWRIEAFLEDWDGLVKVILFGRAVNQYGGLFQEGEIVTVTGRVMHYQAADSTYIRVDKAERAVASGEQSVLVFGGAAQVLRRAIEERCTLGDLKVALVDATGRRIDLGIRVAAGEEEKIRSLPDVHQVLVV